MVLQILTSFNILHIALHFLSHETSGHIWFFLWFFYNIMQSEWFKAVFLKCLTLCTTSENIITGLLHSATLCHLLMLVVLVPQLENNGFNECNKRTHRILCGFKVPKKHASCKNTGNTRLVLRPERANQTEKTIWGERSHRDRHHNRAFRQRVNRCDAETSLFNIKEYKHFLINIKYMLIEHNMGPLRLQTDCGHGWGQKDHPHV